MVRVGSVCVGWRERGERGWRVEMRGILVEMLKRMVQRLVKWMAGNGLRWMGGGNEKIVGVA